ncbi:MAG TPA: rhamnulokinase family protein [Fimbriimonadaceae bacterium]|nr:rhamnulokinase family protein [Fimbriimonadaceae bacterium]
MNRHVAIDLGASGGRVALGSVEDGRIEIEVLHRFPNGGTWLPSGLYWDVIGLWREILFGLKLAGERGRIDSVGVNSWGVDYALLDENDLLIDQPHHYRDARTEGVMEALFKRVPRDRIYERTGIQFMALNTIFQLIAHEKHAPGILGKTRTLLLMPDLIHFWLCGRRASELTIASTTQLFDPRGRCWDEELIRECGLPRGIFQEIVEPGTPLGPIRPEIADPIGLGGAQVIAPAAHDTASAVAAVPASGEDWAYISSGTWALAGVEAPAPVISPKTLELNLTNEAGVRGTTRLLKNITGLWILQECRRAWGDPDYADLYAEARAGDSKGATIDPDDARFTQVCDRMPQRVQEFCAETGRPVPQGRGEITRCVLESLAEKSADVLSQLEAATGRPIRDVHIVGGGSQIDLLNELVAEASGRRVIAGPVDATLTGNLLIQAESFGSIPSGSVREVVRRSETPRVFEPKAPLSPPGERVYEPERSEGEQG